MFEIINPNTGKVPFDQTIIRSLSTGKYYLVGSNTLIARKTKTFIYECDKEGNILSDNQVYNMQPANHQLVLQGLFSGTIPESAFSRKGEEAL